MVIDFASIIYMILAMYVVGAILVGGFLILSVWGLKKVLTHLHEKGVTGNQDHRTGPTHTMGPHSEGLRV